MLLTAAAVACRSPARVEVGARVRASPPTTPAEVVDAATDMTPCQRYDEVIERVRACTAIPSPVRDDLLQRHVDTGASISENGLEGEVVDADALCNEGLDDVRTRAATCVTP